MTNKNGRWTNKIGAGWWFQPTPLKNDGVKVSWDYYSQYMESHKNYVPNHQPGRVEYQI